MPRQKEIAPSLESKRENDRKVQPSVTPWTPKAQAAIVAVWVLFGVAGIAVMVIP